MRTGLLMRRRMVLDHEIREPTLLGLALSLTGLAVLIGTWLAAIAFVPAFGHIWWTFLALSAILVWLVLSLRDKRKPSPAPPTSRQRWCRRLVASARIFFIGALACWLGLIVFSVLCPGGRPPEPKADSSLIRVVTRNIHCGQDEGVPWKQFDWPVRKLALRAALDQAQPDILCVQEATPDQVAFLEKALPDCRRVGVGRDGETGGEHCAIYFNRQRFDMIGGNTFWLEQPTDQPRPGSALDVKRICTWVRLRDSVSGRMFRLYNTHLYLIESPRKRQAATIILDHVAAGDPTDAVLLTADFNASPAKPSRRLFIAAGLADSAERAGLPAGKPTFHNFYGIGVQCLDGILVDPHWRVGNHLLLDVKPQNTFPSDHFALLADLELLK